MALLQKAYLGSTALFKETAWFEGDAQTLVNESSSVTVTANSTAHTKGSWAQLIASTSANASLIYVRVAGVGVGATNTATLLDIGLGAAGSETSIISDIGIGGAESSTTLSLFYFVVPIKIPSGSRVSARIQSVVTGGKTASVLVRLLSVGNYSDAPSSIDVLGAVTANSTATPLANSTNTWTQIVSSTSRAYKAVAFVPSLCGDTVPNALLNYTIGKGASGSEVDIAKHTARISNGEQVLTGDYPFYPANIPSGTRLAVKADTASFHNNHAVSLIGIP